MKKLLLVALVLLVAGGIGYTLYRSKGKCFLRCSKRSTVSARTPQCLPRAPESPKLDAAKIAHVASKSATANGRRIDCRFEELTLDVVLKTLAEKGLNVVYSAPFAQQCKVTANLRQVSVLEAAEAILKVANVAYKVDNGIVLVGR